MSVATACPAPAPRRRWQKLFLTMLPAIICHARIAFRNVRGQDRDDKVQETDANALVAFRRLVQLNKTDLAYPSVPARFAVAQIADGSTVGTPMNVKDVSSPYRQRVKKVVLERLDRYDENEQSWDEVLVEDRSAGPADIARTRIDFSDWLASLKRRDRKIAQVLANGESTRAAAKKFRVSDGRFSQLRNKLAQHYRRFVGDEPGPAAANAA